MIQSLINFLYRHPKSKLKLFNRFGGYFNYRKMMKGRELMKKESDYLSPVQSHPEGLIIYFLTGNKYLYQTLFCIQSLVRVSAVKFKFILVDDGSFDKKLIERIHLQLPGAEIITKEIIEKNLHKYLPSNKYPFLHQKRKVYPHIKKLTDVHTIPGNTWKLALDSDMLFWCYPEEIIEWLHKPNKPLHMVDCEESYGYSYDLMEVLSGYKIRTLINVGAIGLNSDKINWDKIERWSKILEEREGSSYYLEQALSAMIISSADSIALNSKEYIVNPNKRSINSKLGTLHHYVDLSKDGYFRTAWQNQIQ